MPPKGAGEAPASEAQGPLRVEEIQDNGAVADGFLSVYGRVRNTGRAPACRVRLFLRMFDEHGVLLSKGETTTDLKVVPVGRRRAVRGAPEGAPGRTRLAGAAPRRPRRGPRADELAAGRARRGRGAGFLGGMPVSVLALGLVLLQAAAATPSPAPTPTPTPRPSVAGPRTLQDVARERQLAGAQKGKGSLVTISGGPSTETPAPTATPEAGAAPAADSRPGGRRPTASVRVIAVPNDGVVDSAGGVRVNGTVRNGGFKAGVQRRDHGEDHGQPGRRTSRAGRRRRTRP